MTEFRNSFTISCTNPITSTFCQLLSSLYYLHNPGPFTLKSDRQIIAVKQRNYNSPTSCSSIITASTPYCSPERPISRPNPSRLGKEHSPPTKVPLPSLHYSSPLLYDSPHTKIPIPSQISTVITDRKMYHDNPVLKAVLGDLTNMSWSTNEEIKQIMHVIYRKCFHRPCLSCLIIWRY